MPNLLLDRYRNGEHSEVWRDLLELGSAVRHELYYNDAKEVAADTMKRARHNVETIVPKLDELGYLFWTPGEERLLADPIEVVQKSLQQQGLLGAGESVLGQFAKYSEPGFEPRNAHEATMAQMAKQMAEMRAQMAARAPQIAERRDAFRKQAEKLKGKPSLENQRVFNPPTSSTLDDLEEFEETFRGPMPMSLRAWYEQVGAVDFMGKHELLNPMNGPHAADPLVVFPFKESAESDMDPEEGFDGEEFHLALAPDDLHKADTSGGDPYSMKIPDAAADAPLLWEWHNTTFVEYLRIVFAWGGFPGLERFTERPEKELAYLREGLLAL